MSGLISRGAMAIALGAAPMSFGVEVAAVSLPPVEFVELTEFAGLDRPVDLAWRANDDGMYAVSQRGVVVRTADGAATPVLDISDHTEFGGEQGMLGLAFAPDGAYAYVNYSARGVGTTVIAEFAVSPDGMFDAASMRTVLEVEQPYDNHNGGDLAFGPDGLLYIGMGDGGSGGDPERRAQNLDELLGKMLRIDPATPSGDLGYSVPPDNPYVEVDGARPEIWSVGLRNPWRFSFDPLTGDLWIADVGQGDIEEINVAPATDGLDAGRGANFGWSAFEGSARFNDDVAVDSHAAPLLEYSHDGERCSVSGGTRVRGAAAGALDGWYVFADYCSREVFAIEVTGEGAEITASELGVLGSVDGAVTAVVSGPDGAVYVLTHNDPIYRLEATG